MADLGEFVAAVTYAYGDLCDADELRSQMIAEMRAICQKYVTYSEIKKLKGLRTEATKKRKIDDVDQVVDSFHST